MSRLHLVSLALLASLSMFLTGCKFAEETTLVEVRDRVGNLDKTVKQTTQDLLADPRVMKGFDLMNEVRPRDARTVLDLVHGLPAVTSDLGELNDKLAVLFASPAWNAAVGIDDDSIQKLGTDLARAGTLMEEYERDARPTILAGLALAFLAGILALIGLANQARHRFEDCLTTMSLGRGRRTGTMSKRQTRAALAWQAYRDFWNSYAFAWIVWLLTVPTYFVIFWPAVTEREPGFADGLALFVLAISALALLIFQAQEQAHMRRLSCERMGCLPTHLSCLPTLPSAHS